MTFGSEHDPVPDYADMVVTVAVAAMMVLSLWLMVYASTLPRGVVDGAQLCVPDRSIRATGFPPDAHNLWARKTHQTGTP